MARLTDQYKSLTHDLVRRLLNLEKWKRDVTGDSPLFDIANEHTPATLTGNQNNYDPGYYDVLRVNATDDISITGITRGKKGRFLEFYNVSSYKITFPNESTSSTAANRIINSTGQNIVLFPTGRVRMYYDSTLTRWIIPDPPSYKGIYGISFRAYSSSGTQTIADDGAAHQILFDTEDSGQDEWGIWDTGTSIATIPAGLGGLWTGDVKGYWELHGVDGAMLQLGVEVNLATQAGLGIPSISLETQYHSLSFSLILNPGDQVYFTAYQATGGDRNFRSAAVRMGLFR